MKFERAMSAMRKGSVVSTGKKVGCYYEYVYKIIPWCAGKEKRMARYVIDHSEQQPGNWICDSPDFEEILSDDWKIIRPGKRVISKERRKVSISKT